MRGQFAKSQIDPLVIDPYFKQVVYVNNVNDDSVNSNFGYGPAPSASGAPTVDRQDYAAKWGTAGMHHVAGTGGTTGGYILLGGSGATSYAIGSQDFTMEMWFYMASSGRGFSGTFNYGLLSLNTVTGTSNKVWLLQFIGNSSSFATSTANHAFYDGASFSPPASYMNMNTWNHISVCRQGSNLYSSINGVVSATGTTSFNLTTISTLGTRLGSDAAGENQYSAYFDDVRMTVGFARYTKNYPVPTKQLPIPTRPNN
jgi:hypothetical protein